MERGGISHPKVLELSTQLFERQDVYGPELARTVAVGVLEHLWQWVAEYTPNGALGRYGARTIAHAVHWPYDPDQLMEALLHSGLIDAHPTHTYIVHDWPDWCGKDIHRLLAKRIELFADGSLPDLWKLWGDERKEIIPAYYEAFPQHEEELKKMLAKLKRSSNRSITREKLNGETSGKASGDSSGKQSGNSSGKSTVGTKRKPQTGGGKVQPSDHPLKIDGLPVENPLENYRPSSPSSPSIPSSPSHTHTADAGVPPSAVAPGDVCVVVELLRGVGLSNADELAELEHVTPEFARAWIEHANANAENPPAMVRKACEEAWDPPVSPAEKANRKAKAWADGWKPKEAANAS